MSLIKTIPDDLKWRLAAGLAARLPALYDATFRTVVGEKYDEIEQEIWIELSRMAADITRDLSLPAGNARDLAESMRTVMTILFGPDYKSETLEVSEDGAVILIRRCPLLEAGHLLGDKDSRAFHKCMAFTLTTTAQLDRNYAARFVRTMCTGDRQCEIKVEPAKPADTSETRKK